MRPLLLLALLLAASAHAQARLELTTPLLLIDGQRTLTDGAPLTAAPFDGLEMEIPSWGTLTVSDAPFEGARRAGDFDRTRLVLVVDGRSVRLRSETPLLANTPGPVPAYARLETNPLTPTEGPAYLRLTRLDTALALPPVEPPDPPYVDPPAPSSGATDELVRQLETLRAERAQLRTALANAEAERDDAQLRLLALRQEVELLRQEVAGGGTEEDQLRQERDALLDEVQRLRASLAALGTPAARSSPPRPVLPAPARVSLPEFDLARLGNADQIQALLGSVQYPEWAQASAIGGDVLVLFLTDESGAVVRTAVPRPIGGGLDALAEEIVRTMRFTPVRADGQPTRLRSQVVVRFTP